MARSFTADTIVSLKELFNQCFYSTNEALTTIDRAHGYIHAGRHYEVFHEFTGVADTDVVQVLLTSGQAQNHLQGFMSSTCSGKVEFILNPTITSAGTTLDIRNRRPKFQATAVSESSAGHTPTISGGTSLEPQYIGTAGNPQTSIGGEGRSENEWVIEDGDSIAIRFTASSAGEVVLGFDWYEVQD